MFSVKLQVKGNSETMVFLGTFQNAGKTLKKTFEQLPLDSTKVTPLWKVIEIQILYFSPAWSFVTLNSPGGGERASGLVNPRH